MYDKLLKPRQSFRITLYLYLFVLEPRTVADDSMLNTEFSGTDLVEGCQSRSHLEPTLILQITLSREGWFRGESRCRAVLIIVFHGYIISIRQQLNIIFQKIQKV